MKSIVIAALVATALSFGGEAGAEELNATSTGDTKIDACSNAKHSAQLACDSETVKDFGECECESGSFEGGDSFRCSVDATCEDADEDSDEKADERHSGH